MAHHQTSAVTASIRVSPNENFPVENFKSGIRLNRALLGELGK
jgi:hypothetical protein